VALSHRIIARTQFLQVGIRLGERRAAGYFR
jgi:hypothetical protein